MCDWLTREIKNLRFVKNAMPERRRSPRLTVDEHTESFIVKDANSHGRDRRRVVMHRLTREARRIAVNFAKLLGAARMLERVSYFTAQRARIIGDWLQIGSTVLA